VICGEREVKEGCNKWREAAKKGREIKEKNN
jgi:hypothetical protein